MNVGTAHSEVNPNTRVMNSRGIWLSYVLAIGLLHVVLLSIPFVSVPVVWTLTNLIHNMVRACLQLCVGCSLAWLQGGRSLWAQARCQGAVLSTSVARAWAPLLSDGPTAPAGLGSSPCTSIRRITSADLSVPLGLGGSWASKGDHGELDEGVPGAGGCCLDRCRNAPFSNWVSAHPTPASLCPLTACCLPAACFLLISRGG